MMTKQSATALAAWMLKHQPGVFATMLKTHAKRTGAKLGALGDDELQPVDVTAQYINGPDISSTFSTPDYDLNVGNPLSLNVDTSAANATTTSILGNLGSDVGGAISSVASFLLKGAAAVAPVAVAALQAKTAAGNQQVQAAVLAAQLGRAQAGVAPANIAYTANGTPVYIPTANPTGGLTTMPAGLGQQVTLPNGQVGYTLTQQALTNLAPSFLQKYGIWILGGGAAVALALFLS
jgi:hypothetical protein